MASSRPRSSRLANKTPSKAPSQATSIAPRSNRRAPPQAVLPSVAPQQSSAYGASSSVQLDKNQFGHKADFTKIFQQTRATAIQRDATAESMPPPPSNKRATRASTVESVNDNVESSAFEYMDDDGDDDIDHEFTESAEPPTITVNSTFTTSNDQSKSFGQEHEAGLLGNNAEPQPRRSNLSTRSPQKSQASTPSRRRAHPNITPPTHAKAPANSTTANPSPTNGEVLLRTFQRGPWRKILLMVGSILLAWPLIMTFNWAVDRLHSMSDSNYHSLQGLMSNLKDSYDNVETFGPRLRELEQDKGSLLKLADSVQHYNSFLKQFKEDFTEHKSAVMDSIASLRRYTEEAAAQVLKEAEARDEALEGRMNAKHADLERNQGVLEEDVKVLRKDFAASRKILEDQMRLLPTAKLESLLRTAYLSNKEFARKHINWLLPAYGTVVLPQLTSPSQKKRYSVLARAYSTIRFFPAPKPAITALLPWKMPGDCWCAAPSTSKGKAQLGLHLQTPIYPELITIDNPPKDMIPDSTSAPKELELWALVPNATARSEMETRLDETFGRCKSNFKQKNYVCLTAFEYDIHGINNIQSSGMYFNLAELNVPVQRLVLRVNENWGREWTCLYQVSLSGRPAVV